MEVTLLTYFVLLVLGLVVGSFLTMFTYRYPRGEKLGNDRSRCDKCKKKIGLQDNIPLLSYALLGGKCRSCGKKISVRYPLIELATAVGFVGAFYVIGNCNSGVYNSLIETPLCTWNGILGGMALPFFLVIYTILVAIFVIDSEHQLIPDSLTFSIYVITIAVLILTNPSNLFTYFLVGFGSALFLLLINLATKGKGMGLGDVKFAIAGGTLIGWPGVLTWMMFAFVIGAVVGLFLIIAGKASFSKKIAFGPFLVIGLVLALVLPMSIYVLF